MPRLLSCKVSLSVAIPEGRTDRRNGLWAFVTPKGNTKKILGQAQVNEKGKAEINLKLPSTEPGEMDVLVYPLSSLTDLRRIKTEKAVASKWKKNRNQFNTDVKIELSKLFLSSLDWLDEVFTVEGRLINRFTDPETEIVNEIPIYHGLVKIFDVDKKKGISVDCIPNRICSPILTECIPNRICSPNLTECVPKDLCIPSDIVCTPYTICSPRVTCEPLTICIPDRLCRPSLNCRPLYEVEYDPWEEIPHEIENLSNFRTLLKTASKMGEGCCGSEYKSFMQPIASPALALEKSRYNLLLECLPLFINRTTYTKTQLSNTYETEPDGRFWFQFSRQDYFEAVASSTHTEDLDWDEFPDLLFEAQLGIEGSLRTIYSESYSETRWNQGLYLYVDLYVDGDLSLHATDTDIDADQDESFLFHGVGNVEPGWINSEGIIKSAPAATGLNEYVFGGRMHIKGQFNNTHKGKYYQVEYQCAGESSWNAVVGEQWYYSVYVGNNQWETHIKSPVTLSGIEGCYIIPDYTDLDTTQKELILPWTSYRMDGNIPRYPNGHYRFRVNLIEEVSPGNYAVAPTSTHDPMSQILNVTIDNNWPVAQFSDQLYVGENVGGTLNLSSVEPCGFVEGGLNRYLILNFTAVDLEKHFRRYIIQMNRGSESYITVPNAGLPSTITTNPSLSGFKLSPSEYTFNLPTDNFPNGYVALNLGTDPWLGGNTLKQCAYNFTLTVYDRVTNGYGHIHWSKHPITLTIME